MGFLRRVLGGAPARPAGVRYAVVDVETTGLHPSTDRIVEVAVVRLDPRGAILDEWTTLVDPGRDVGPTEIHGITPRAVMGAPRFADVAPELLWRLGGHVVAAHNASFDRTFLSYELERAGSRLGEDDQALCTMWGCYRGGLVGARSLAACCAELGVSHADEHTALGDARAAAGLLAVMLSRVGASAMGAPGPWREASAPAAACSVRLRTDPPHPRVNLALGSLADRVATPSGTGASEEAAGAYFALLDRVLEDRRVDLSEVGALAELATAWGLGHGALWRLNEAYVGGMWALARADGFVTPAELADLEAVAELLGVPLGDGSSAGPEARVMAPAESSLVGRSVCFTGASVCTLGGIPLSREAQERIAGELGMVVKSGVSRKLDVLVLADPDSQSGKAGKAEELGVRRMAEPAFWRALGVEID